MCRGCVMSEKVRKARMHWLTLNRKEKNVCSVTVLYIYWHPIEGHAVGVKAKVKMI